MLVILGLAYERRRRRIAEGKARQRLLELVHLNQSATAGALSASIAHELNQPLGAIRINAEAAEAMLRSEPPNLDVIRQILADIRADDQRASDIIQQLRGMLRKRSDIDWQEFDINEVLESCVAILRAEAERRSITLTAHQTGRRLPVKADRVHVQQVVLNLATNAMDAMLELPPSAKRISFETALVGEAHAEISVSDGGHGIPKISSTACSRLSSPPNRTAPGSACRSLAPSSSPMAVELGGNRPAGGAVLRFVLPLAQQ